MIQTQFLHLRPGQIFVCTLLAVLSSAANFWDFPVLPSSTARVPVADFGDKLIPRHLWLTFRDAPKRNHNVTGNNVDALVQRQVAQNWTIHMCDDVCALTFMRTAFAGTSLLWAYESIHSRLGVARADIWRYAVLWYYGGVYIDDDAYIFRSFDEIIEPNDTLILSYEKSILQEDCYHPLYSFSLTSLHKEINSSSGSSSTNALMDLLKGHVVVNWLIFAAPGNTVLAETLRNIVRTLTLEYQQRSALQHYHSPDPNALALRPYNSKGHHLQRKMSAWKRVICLTGPIQLSLSALWTSLKYPLLLPTSRQLLQVRPGPDFRDDGGVFKVKDHIQHREDHYTHFMERESVSILAELTLAQQLLLYNTTQFLERRIISPGGKDMYLVFEKQRWVVTWHMFQQLKCVTIKDVLPVDRRTIELFLPLHNHSLTMVEDGDWVRHVLSTPRFLDVDVKAIS